MESGSLTFEIAFIALLILLNGFFSGSEMAIVTARRTRMSALAAAGNRGAAAVMGLRADPDRFLATVQIGITVVGTLASAVGGATIVERLAPALASLGGPVARFAQPAAVGLVVFTISYLSLVLGELVPKSLAVRHGEALALRVARGIDWLSRASRPAVVVLTASSKLVLRLLGQGSKEPPQFHTLEDLRAIVQEAQDQGVIETDMLRGAIEFQDREVREVMTPHDGQPSEDLVQAGLVLHRLGTVPPGGERMDVPPHRLTVLAVDGRRVTRVRIGPFAHLYETGGMRRTHLRGHANIRKRLLTSRGRLQRCAGPARLARALHGLAGCLARSLN